MAATAAASSSSTMPAASWDETKLTTAKIKDHAAPANSTTIAKRRIAEANRRAAAGWTMERIMPTAWDPRRTARYYRTADRTFRSAEGACSICVQPGREDGPTQAKWLAVSRNTLSEPNGGDYRDDN